MADPLNGASDWAAHLIAYEGAWRLGAFFAIFVLFAALERAFPRRHGEGLNGCALWRRWRTNFLLLFTANALIRLAVPITATAWALRLDGNAGLLALVALPFWVEALIAIILLDLTLYAQHVLFHKSNMLWRLHAVHHADENLDVSSGLRFHYCEIFVSLGIKLFAIALIGPHAAAVIVFEILLNASALFNHANWTLGSADRRLQCLLVTPDMHRVHHATAHVDSQTNFGFFLSFWDHAFGTYQAKPSADHKGLKLGLDGLPRGRGAELGWALRAPFKTQNLRD